MVAEGVAISIISYGELYEGAYHGRIRTAALLVLARFVEAIEIVPLSREIVEGFGVERGTLSRQDRRQVGDMDLLIGATALTYDITLATRNIRDYRLIPNLRLYQSPAQQS